VKPGKTTLFAEIWVVKAPNVPGDQPLGDRPSGATRRVRGVATGREELERWFAGPVSRDGVPRLELAIKLIFAVRSQTADVHAVIQHQRAATMRSLQELTRLKGEEGTDDLAWTLTLDGLLFQGEAEIRWLDLCEARLSGAAPAPTAPSPAPPPRRRAATEPTPLTRRSWP
jgi:Virulence activator alpha C-term